MRISLLIVLAWMSGFLRTAGFAQGTAEDYHRAAGLRERFEHQVFRDPIHVHWLADNRHGWYRVETALQAHEFILFDAMTGSRGPAFDHVALAEALKSAGVPEVTAPRLPLGGLKLDAERREAEFDCGGRRWRFDWVSQMLREIPEAETPIQGRSWVDAPKASRRTGAETSITFQNRTSESVDLFWLDAEGERRGYGRLGAGERRDQHTFAGHVWLVMGSEGQPLAVFVADEEPMQAEIVGVVKGDATSGAGASRDTQWPGLSPDGLWQAMIEEHNLVLKQVRTGERVAHLEGWRGRGWLFRRSTPLVAGLLESAGAAHGNSRNAPGSFDRIFAPGSAPAPAARVRLSQTGRFHSAVEAAPFQRVGTP